MKLGRFTGVACLLLSAFALSANAQTAPPPSDAANSSAGLTASPIYQKNCSKCHGKNAEGKHLFGGPALTSEKTASMSADDLRNIITKGKGHMPKYSGKLAPNEIDALVEQIRAAGTPKK